MLADTGGAVLFFLSVPERMCVSHEKQPRGSGSAPGGLCVEETLRAVRQQTAVFHLWPTETSLCCSHCLPTPTLQSICDWQFLYNFLILTEEKTLESNSAPSIQN